MMSPRTYFAEFKTLLADLHRAQPPSAELCLYVGAAPGIMGSRGPVLFHDQRPTASATPQASPSTPAVPKLAQQLKLPVTELRLGDYLNLELRSPVAGYAHLFNCGTSGDIFRLLPNPPVVGSVAPPEPPPGMQADQHYYLTSINRRGQWHWSLTQLFEDAATPLIEAGPLSPEPERLLLLVTPHPDTPLPSLLAPPPVPLPFRRDSPRTSGPWDQLGLKVALLNLPTTTWAWGYFEAPVHPATQN